MPPFGEFGGYKLLSFLALIITVFCTARLVSLVDNRAGLYAAVLMACSPAFLESFRHVEFEPVLTAFCAAGLYFFVRGAWHRHLLVCFVGGALVGCGFLTKMWLIVPYAFALIAFCVIEAASVRSQGTSAGLRKSVAAGGTGFVLTAAAHLVFVSVVAPSDLPDWVSSVYFGIFSGQGVTGGKLSALASYADHERTVSYYPLVLYRDHFFLLPLSLFGLGELLRQPRPRTSRLLAMIIGALTAVVVLSVPAYKEARYVLPVAPFLYALAGLSLAAFARAPDKLRPNSISVVRVAMMLSGIAWLTLAIAHVAGVSSELGRPYLLAHAFGTLLCIALGELWMRTRFVTRELAALAAIGLIVAAIAQPRLRPPEPPYRAISELLAPHLANAKPGYPSFLSRDHNLLQGYLTRAGLGWDKLTQLPADTTPPDGRLRAYVLAPADLVHGEAQRTLLWLSGHARDLSPELQAKTAGESAGYRVFVRPE
jgi:4-amino-4-deoxy-L-arabinose transferase-like glycosyltransferase